MLENEIGTELSHVRLSGWRPYVERDGNEDILNCQKILNRKRFTVTRKF